MFIFRVCLPPWLDIVFLSKFWIMYGTDGTWHEIVSRSFQVIPILQTFYVCGMFPEYISVHHLCALRSEGPGGHWLLWNWTVTNCQVGASNQTLVLPEHPVFSVVEPSFHSHSHPFKSIMTDTPFGSLHSTQNCMLAESIYSKILTRACCCEIFNIFSVGVEDPILVLVYIPWVVSLVSSFQIYFIICELLYPVRCL